MQLELVQPTAGQPVADDFSVAVHISSTFSIASVGATINGAQSSLAADGTGQNWSGRLSGNGLPWGDAPLVVTATDVKGNSGSSTFTVRVDRPPTVQLLEPAPFAAVGPDLHYHLVCTDDSPEPCTTHLVLMSRTTGIDPGPGPGQGVICLDQGAQEYGVSAEATDSAGQTTRSDSLIYIDPSLSLKPMATYGGLLLDADATRAVFVVRGPDRSQMLWLVKPPMPVQSVGGVPGGGDCSQIRTSFCPADNSQALLSGDGVLYLDPTATLAEFPSSGSLDAGHVSSFAVAGDWAIWWTEFGPLTRRRLSSGQDESLGRVVPVELPCGRTACDVFQPPSLAPDGTVAFLGSGGVYVASDAGVVLAVDAGDGPLPEVLFPQTDGVNLAWTAGPVLIQSGTTQTSLAATSLVLRTPAGEETFPASSPRFALNSGWLAWARQTGSNVQVWERAPDGGVAQLTFWGADSSIEALSPTGEVLYEKDDERWWAGPSGDTFFVGSTLGRPRWIDGSWQILIGNSRFGISNADGGVGACAPTATNPMKKSGCGCGDTGSTEVTVLLAALAFWSRRRRA
jgi:hypothetical protein